MSVLTTLTLKDEMQGVKFFQGISVITLVLFDLQRPHLAKWHKWRGTYFYKVSHVHIPMGRAGQGPATPSFWDFLYVQKYEKKQPNFAWSY